MVSKEVFFITITDSLVTLANVIAYQGKGMDTVTDDAGSLLYSTAELEAIVNQAIRYVYGNAPTDIDSNTQLYYVYEMSRIGMNNRLHEDGKLSNWEPKEMTIEFAAGLDTRKMWVV